MIQSQKGNHVSPWALMHYQLTRKTCRSSTMKHSTVTRWSLEAANKLAYVGIGRVIMLIR
jgi:hypothetical protein